MNILDANFHGALSGGTLLPCAVSPELDQQFIHLYPRVAWPNTRHYSGIYARRINLHKYSEHTEQHNDRVDMDTRDSKTLHRFLMRTPAPDASCRLVNFNILYRLYYFIHI